MPLTVINDLIDKEQLMVLKRYHEECSKLIDMNKIYEQRLDKILVAAEVE